MDDKERANYIVDEFVKDDTFNDQALRLRIAEEFSAVRAEERANYLECVAALRGLIRALSGNDLLSDALQDAEAVIAKNVET